MILNMPTKTEITEFSLLIENISYEENLNYIDSIVYHCEQTGMEIEVASTLLTSVLKAKIREEAEEVNLLKKTSKLPV
jgi:hypothetical protein